MDGPQLLERSGQDFKCAVTKPPFSLLQDPELVWCGEHEVPLIIHMDISNEEVLALQILCVNL